MVLHILVFLLERQKVNYDHLSGNAAFSLPVPHLCFSIP
jgi:hypothetical protein